MVGRTGQLPREIALPRSPQEVFLFPGWAADAGATFTGDGIGTFVFSGGLIKAQTVRCTLRHRR
jgi:hypothetical protein